MPAMDAIVTRGLTKRFRDGTVGVRDLALRVGEGATAALVGPNGAGKTTTIRLLLDLIRPTSGEAEVLGRPVRGAGPSLRTRLGFLPGDLAFHAGLTGHETLGFFARLRAGRPPSLRAELLDRLGLGDGDLRRKVQAYSTGMRRKLGLVVALQHDPQLAILDEPTTGLDPLVRRRCHDAIRGWRGKGRTLLLSSHDMLEVDALAERVLIVRAGELVADRDVEDLRGAEGDPRALEDRVLAWYRPEDE